MIFKTVKETIDYFNLLLEKEILVSPKTVEHICRLNSINISNATFISGENYEPELNSIKILDDESVSLVYKKRGWINHLPGLYQENDFLKRFLFGFEQEFLVTERKIDAMNELFEASNTEFINWLSSWVGVAFSESVPLRSKRRVLNNMVQLYKIRGTKRYFVELITLLTDIDVSINDSTKAVSLHHNLVSKSSKKHHFTIYISTKISNDSVIEKEKLGLIRAIVEREKPINVSFNIAYDYAQAEETNNTVAPQVIDMHIEDADDNSGYDYDNYEGWE
jgi:phage tail-like protein